MSFVVCNFIALNRILHSDNFHCNFVAHAILNIHKGSLRASFEEFGRLKGIFSADYFLLMEAFEIGNFKIS